MIPILANTYFSGAGLMDIGLEAGGLMLQQSFEIDALCCDTLRRNFSHGVVQCDITKKLVQSEKECHVMVATYPCTKYSPIADIHGVRTEMICSCISSGTLRFEDPNFTWSRMFRA
jgi:DNA (cytosine-5)-methyltransferase 1